MPHTADGMNYRATSGARGRGTGMPQARGRRSSANRAYDVHYRFVSSTKTTQLHGVEPIVDHRVRSRLQLLESDYALDIHLGRFASNPGVMHFLL